MNEQMIRIANDHGLEASLNAHGGVNVYFWNYNPESGQWYKSHEPCNSLLQLKNLLLTQSLTW